jgi:hypothetical protein
MMGHFWSRSAGTEGKLNEGYIIKGSMVYEFPQSCLLIVFSGVVEVVPAT